MQLYSENIKWPKISVVTPSFNQGQFIEETILSVINQNYSNLEYIIIDGGSTDNTVEIIKKYQEKINYWISEKDGGQTEALNKGFERCTGQIFNWLNSDDCYLPGALHTVAREFMKMPQLKILCGKEYLVYEDGRKVITKGSTVLNSIEETLFAAHIDQPPTFFDLNLLRKVFPLNENLFYGMDIEMWLNVLLNCQISEIKIVDNIFDSFRIHGNSKTGTNPEDIYLRERHELRYALLQALKVDSKLLNAWYTFFDEKIPLKKRLSLQFVSLNSFDVEKLEAEIFKDLYLYESFELKFSYLRKFLFKFVLNKHVGLKIKSKFLLKALLPSRLLLKILKRQETYFFKSS